MKCNDKIFSLFLISILSAGTIVSAEKSNIFEDFARRSSSFSQAVLKLVEENKIRFSNLQNVIVNLNIDIKRTNLEAQEAKLDAALKDVGESYKKTSQILATVCADNKAALEQLLKLPRLDRHSPNFFEVSKQLMEKQIKLLQSVVNKISNLVDAASENLNKLNLKIINVSGSLTSIQNTLTMLGTARKEDLKNKNRVALEKIEKFLKDVKAYTRWFEVSASNLRNMATPDEKSIQKLEGTVTSGKSLLGTVKNLLSGDNLQKESKEAIVLNSNKITSVVKDISNICLDVKSG